MSNKKRKQMDDGDGGGGGGGPIQWGKKDDEEEGEKAPPKQPVYKKSGLLRAAALSEARGESGVAGGSDTELKYIECADGAMPTKRWVLFPFKGEQNLDVIPLHRKSNYLFGRDRTVADVPTDHLSCSKQHAVIQFRKRPIKDAVRGQRQTHVVPYIMDLGSSNGTLLNGSKLEKERYYELKPNDVIKFALSSRDYVLMFEEMATKK